MERGLRPSFLLTFIMVACSTNGYLRYKPTTQIHMKKLWSFIAVFFTAHMAFAQHVEVKTNPIGFAFGATNLSVEVPLATHPNVTLNASWWHYSEELRDWVDTERIGGASVGIRRYLISDMDEGLYLGMASRYMNRLVRDYDWDPNTGQSTYTDTPSDYASLGFTLGYKFRFEERVSIDLFTGAGRILLKQAGGEYYAPAEWIAGFNFGYRF